MAVTTARRIKPAGRTSESSYTYYMWCVLLYQLQARVQLVCTLLIISCGASYESDRCASSPTCIGQILHWQRVKALPILTGMQSYDNIGPYNHKGEEWPAYCKRVELYLDANNINIEEQRQAVFLSACRASTYQ